jgi:trigger factor
MNVSTEKKDQHTLVIEVSVSEEEVKKAFASATQRIANQVSIPGFRKGKAPRNVLENRIGKEAFEAEAFEAVVNRTYPKALEELSVEPVVQPEIEKVSFEEGKAGSYKATIIVKPQIELGEYKGISATKEVPEVKEEQIEEHIQGLLSRRAKMVDAAEGVAAIKGDMVLIDFLGTVDGVAFEGGEGKSYPLELGSNSFIPGFEDQLIGIKVGEDKTVKVTFPEDYFSEDLKGKDAEFEVHVQSIKTKELPELNDEFAQEVGKFESVEALKEDVKKRLEGTAATEVERNFRAAVLKQLVDAVEVEVPAVMVENRVNNLLAELDLNLQSQGANLDSYLQYAKKTIAEVKADYEEVAKEGVKTDLILEAIAKKENLGVSQRDLDAELRAMALTYDIPVKNVKSYVEKEGHMGNLIMNILRRKAAEFVISSAVSA